MKYAILFCVLSTFSSITHARSIKSFSDSQAITTISEFMMDSASDTTSSYRFSDKKLKLKDTSSCVDVNASDVIKEVENAIKNVLRYYPDEELPVEEAISDLTDYLENNSYKKCIVFQTIKKQSVRSVYFFDSRDVKHVKVDTITLALE